MKTETAAERRIKVLKDILKADIKSLKKEIKNHNNTIRLSQSNFDMVTAIGCKISKEASIECIENILRYLSKPLPKNI